MKKLIYVTLVTLASMVAISSCTEEEVTPTAEADNGGGSTSTGPIK